YRRQRIAAAIISVGVLWTLLAGGWIDPLVGPIIKHIPVINRMRYPIKFLLGPVLAIHFLAALYWRTAMATHPSRASLVEATASASENLATQTAVRNKSLRAAMLWTLLLPLIAIGLALLFHVLSQAQEFKPRLVPLAVHTFCGLALLALIWLSFNSHRIVLF